MRLDARDFLEWNQESAFGWTCKKLKIELQKDLKRLGISGIKFESNWVKGHYSSPIEGFFIIFKNELDRNYYRIGGKFAEESFLQFITRKEYNE